MRELVLFVLKRDFISGKSWKTAACMSIPDGHSASGNVISHRAIAHPYDASCMLVPKARGEQQAGSASRLAGVASGSAPGGLVRTLSLAHVCVRALRIRLERLAMILFQVRQPALIDLLEALRASDG